jgi:type II secretory pathway pseudopilin PulG
MQSELPGNGSHAFCMAAIAASHAYTLLELLFAIALCLVLGAIAAPSLSAAVDDVRAAGAARYVATKLQQARTEAITRSADVGWQFVLTAAGAYTYAPYLDGNGNGIRTYDIQHAIDLPINPLERLPDRFDGVDFGTTPGLPAIDPGGSPPGTNPIRLGSSNILTFSPLGTASSGSLYIKGRRNAQYAVRVSGETGRTRVLRFDLRTGQWKPA